MGSTSVFNLAHQKFSSPILAHAREHQGEQSFNATISKEDLEAYAAAVAELIASAKDLEENSSFVSKAARGKFGRAIQQLQERWIGFVPEGAERLNPDGLAPFFTAMSSFLTARTEFFETCTAALARKTKKARSVE